MKNARAVVLVLTLLVATRSVAQVNANTAAADTESHDIFIKIRTVLLEKTRVPLRLPSYLGPGFGTKNEFFAILEHADPANYEIQLALNPTCNGGNWCHGGTLKGSSDPIRSDYEGRRKSSPVKLAQGIKGTFTQARCFAYCEESVVSWKQDGYYYEIGVKAARKWELVKIANSAIASGKK